MDKQISAAMLDGLTCGIGIYKIAHRKWYNPMRWLKGLVYLKRIKKKDFYA